MRNHVLEWFLFLCGATSFVCWALAGEWSRCSSLLAGAGAAYGLTAILARRPPKETDTP